MMTQMALFIFGEDVAWNMLQVTGIAVLCFALWRFMDHFGLPLSRLEGPFRTQTVSLSELVILVFRLIDQPSIAFATSGGFRYQRERGVA